MNILYDALIKEWPGEHWHRPRINKLEERIIDELATEWPDTLTIVDLHKGKYIDYDHYIYIHAQATVAGGEGGHIETASWNYLCVPPSMRNIDGT